MLQIYFNFCILLSFFFVSDSFSQTCNCDEKIEELWQIRPVGEYQLNSIRSDIENSFGNLKHYPSRSEVSTLLYFLNGTETVYDDFIKHYGFKFDLMEGVYESYAQLGMKQILAFVKNNIEHDPRVIIEVGTFIGSGLLHVWAPYAKSLQEPAIVLCVDTWLGDINMRSAQSFRKFMRLKGGNPTLYHTFMNRVISHNQTDVTFPFVTTSLLAARTISVFNWIVDIVFIDSAHEIGETLSELLLYFQLLRPGGLMIGDDYRDFPAVKHDVDLFVKMKGDQVTFRLFFYENIWGIIKNKPDILEMVVESIE